MTYLNDKLECYFTEAAAKVIQDMVKIGFDKDLAVSVLETLWTEEAIYDLEGADDGRTKNK